MASKVRSTDMAIAVAVARVVGMGAGLGVGFIACGPGRGTTCAATPPRREIR